MGPRTKRKDEYRPFTSTTAVQTRIGWQEILGLPLTLANPGQGLARLMLSILRSGKEKGYDRSVNVHDPSVTVLIRRTRADGVEEYAFIVTERAYRPRPQGMLFPADGRGYVRRILENNLWHALMHAPGTICTELVGGMVDPKDYQNVEGQSYKDFHRAAVMRAGIREAKEETGLTVTIEDVFVDRICPDPAHTLHPQSIAIARAVAEGEQKLDSNEAPKQVIWLTLDEVAHQFGNGNLDDGRILASFFFAGLLVPATKQ